MTSSTTKPDSLQPAADMAGDLFDNWFDPLEAEVRARSREFIEELLRGELEAALSRPRYGRSPMSGSEGRASVAGHRHGSRTRSLTGEPIVRVILDGTVVRVRLDRKPRARSLSKVLAVPLVHSPGWLPG